MKTPLYMQQPVQVRAVPRSRRARRGSAREDDPPRRPARAAAASCTASRSPTRAGRRCRGPARGRGDTPSRRRRSRPSGSARGRGGRRPRTAASSRAGAWDRSRAPARRAGPPTSCAARVRSATRLVELARRDVAVAAVAVEARVVGVLRERRACSRRSPRGTGRERRGDARARWPRRRCPAPSRSRPWPWPGSPPASCASPRAPRERRGAGRGATSPRACGRPRRRAGARNRSYHARYRSQRSFR